MKNRSPGTSSDKSIEESSEEEDSMLYEEETSSEEISSEEEKTDPQLFTLQTGQCIGDCSKIELLITYEMKVFRRELLTEEIKESIYKGICVWTEAESTDEDPWITSFFSFVKYDEIADCMYPEVHAEMKKLRFLHNVKLFISGRFINIPDEVVFEMYQSLPSYLQMDEKDKIFFLSLERPITQLETNQIKRAFPSLNISKLKNMFPMYAEEVFLSISGFAPSFTFRKETSVIKGYLMDKKDLLQFISAFKEYFSSS